LKQDLLNKEEKSTNEENKAGPEPSSPVKPKVEPNWMRESYAIFKMGILPTIAVVFHPMYQIVNSIFLGQMEDATQLQASFGLASMLINIFMQSIVLSFTSGAGTFIG
jgi:Na+-driven multidrug efflux pump